MTNVIYSPSTLARIANEKSCLTDYLPNKQTIRKISLVALAVLSAAAIIVGIIACAAPASFISVWLLAHNISSTALIAAGGIGNFGVEIALFNHIIKLRSTREQIKQLQAEQDKSAKETNSATKKPDDDGVFEPINREGQTYGHETT